MGTSRPAFALKTAQDDAFPALISSCHIRCSSTRKTEADQGSRRLRQCVWGCKAGLQQGQGGGETVEDSWSGRRQDLLCPVLRLEDQHHRVSCGNAVDSTHSRSVADMAKYFNTATSNNLNVVTPICKAATIAFFNAMIKGASNVEANVAAAQAYMPFN